MVLPFSSPRLLLTLVAACAVMGLGQAALFTFQPLLMAATGLSLARINGAFALGSALFLVGTPLWALVGDRIGRKPVLMVALAGFLVSHVFLLGLVLACRAGRLSGDAVGVGLLLSRVVYGLTVSGLVTATQGWLVAGWPADKRLLGLSRLSAGLTFGRLVGPLLAAATLWVSPLGPLWLVALAALPVLAALGGLAEARTMPTVATVRPWPVWRGLAPYWLVAFVSQCTLGLVQYVTASWLVARLHWSPEVAAARLGGMMGLAGAGSLAVQLLLLPRLARAERQAVRAAWGLVPALALMPLTGSGWSAWLGLASLAAVLALVVPTYTHRAVEVTGAGNPGRVSAALATAHTVGYTVSAALGGWLFDRHPDAPLWLAVLGALLLAGMLGCVIRPSREAAMP